MFLLAYAGLFRYKELSNIRMTNIAFYDTHIEILVETSKTDIHRQGNTVVIARTNTETCPVLFLRRYCTLAGLNLDSNEYIFRSLQYNKSNHKGTQYNKSNHKCTISKVNKPLSYTRSRDLLLEAVSAIGLDKTLFGLHGLRSGGASQATNNNVTDRVFKAHGRWRSENAKDGYVN
jgi:hypothetical protein